MTSGDPQGQYGLLTRAALLKFSSECGFRAMKITIPS